MSTSSLLLRTRYLAILLPYCFLVLVAGMSHASYGEEGRAIAITELVRAIRPSVVSIYMRGLMNPEQSTSGTSPVPQVSEQVGTGAIVFSDGYIVTNKHVVKNAYHVEVSLYDGTHVRANVVAVS